MAVPAGKDHGDEAYTTATQELDSDRNVWTMALETSIKGPMMCRGGTHGMYHGKPRVVHRKELIWLLASSCTWDGSRLTRCHVLGRESRKTDGWCIGRQKELAYAGHGVSLGQEGEKFASVVLDMVRNIWQWIEDARMDYVRTATNEHTQSRKTVTRGMFQMIYLETLRQRKLNAKEVPCEIGKSILRHS